MTSLQSMRDAFKTLKVHESSYSTSKEVGSSMDFHTPNITHYTSELSLDKLENTFLTKDYPSIRSNQWLYILSVKIVELYSIRILGSDL